MKKLYSLSIAAVLLTSCSTAYYQLATVASPEIKPNKVGTLVYSDKEYSISYDFWGEGGNMFFVFENKTDKDVYVDLSRSFLLVNGITNDYYQNREWSSPYSPSAFAKKTSFKSVASAVGTPPVLANALKSINEDYLSSTPEVFSESHVSAYIEKEGVWVPAKASRTFKEFGLMASPYRKCGFDRFPKESSDPLSFSLESSPRVFTNILTIKEGDSEKQIKNTFYISEIQNSPAKYVLEEVAPTNCRGEKIGPISLVMKVYSPNMFYTSYVRSLANRRDDDVVILPGARKNIEVVEETIVPILSEEAKIASKSSWSCSYTEGYGNEIFVTLDSSSPYLDSDMVRVKDAYGTHMVTSIKHVEKKDGHKYVLHLKGKHRFPVDIIFPLFPEKNITGVKKGKN